MWKKIVNPKTGKKVNLNSKIGKRVLRNYIKQLGGADESDEGWSVDELTGKPIPPRKCVLCGALPGKETFVLVGSKDWYDFPCYMKKYLPQCGICFNPILKYSSNQFTTSCEHKFHRDCLLRWLRISNTCPICRNDIPYSGWSR